MKATLLLALAACAPKPPPKVREAPRFPHTCDDIAAAIEDLRPQFPALVEYRAATAQQHACWISYGWHTHPSQHAGGWTAGVPNPDNDGVWFYIGIYDPNGPDAQAQINMQPVMPNWWLGDRKVMFLMLAGDDVKGLEKAVFDVLQIHGLVTH